MLLAKHRGASELILRSEEFHRGVGRVVIDTSRAPVIGVRYVGDPSEAVFEQSLEQLTQVIAEGSCSVVYDARYALVGSAKRRHRQALWLDENRQMLHRNCAGVAFCTGSALVRGAIRAIFWFNSPPFPFLVTDNSEEAESWARNQFARFTHRRRSGACAG